ncbi:MAG: hypothetical protein EA375_01805 [Acholeplasmataceae bacterium]|nr:MAG: hypothetical protein EA375_01805 [Acholeplasmataceae bacterium]
MEFFIGFAVVVGVIALYMGSMFLNAKTEVPEECREAYLEAQSCDTCAMRSGICGFKDVLETIRKKEAGQ